MAVWKLSLERIVEEEGPEAEADPEEEIARVTKPVRKMSFGKKEKAPGGGSLTRVLSFGKSKKKLDGVGGEAAPGQSAAAAGGGEGGETRERKSSAAGQLVRKLSFSKQKKPPAAPEGDGSEGSAPAPVRRFSFGRKQSQ